MVYPPGLTYVGQSTDEDLRKRRAYKKLASSEPQTWTATEAQDIGIDLSSPDFNISDWQDWTIETFPDFEEEDGIGVAYISPAGQRLDSSNNYTMPVDYSVFPDVEGVASDEVRSAVQRVWENRGESDPSLDIMRYLYPNAQIEDTPEYRQEAQRYIEGVLYMPSEEEFTKAISFLAPGNEINLVDNDAARQQLVDLANEDMDAFISLVSSKGYSREAETIFRSVGFTGQNIEDIFGWQESVQQFAPYVGAVNPELTNTYDISNALREWQANPEALRSQIQAQGWSPERETLVRSLYPDLSDAQIRDFIYGDVALITDVTGKSIGVSADSFVGKFVYNINQGKGNFWSGLGATLSWLGGGDTQDDPLTDLGLGQLSNTVGSWLLNRSADKITEKGLQYEIGEGAGWGFVRSLPLQAALMIPSLVIGQPLGAYVGGVAEGLLGVAGSRLATAGITGIQSAAAIWKVSPYVGYILESAGIASVSRLLEGTFEAGQEWQQLINQGWSEEDARRAATNTFFRNMELIGMDAVQWALYLQPFKSVKVSQNLLNNKLVRYAGKGLAIGTAALTEGGEEYYQQIIQLQEAGEDIDTWAVGKNLSREDILQVTLIGAMSGGVFAGVSNVFGIINNLTVDKLPTELQTEVRAKIADRVRGGETEEQAINALMSEQINVPEVKQAIDEATEEAKALYYAEQLAASKARIEFLRSATGITTPSLETVQGARMELGGEMFQFEGIRARYEELVSKAEQVAPNNPVVKEARHFLGGITQENQIEVIRRLEELEAQLKVIAGEPAVEPKATDIAKGLEPEIVTETTTGEGVQPDMFGGETRKAFKSRGEATQMGMDDYMKYKEAMATKERDLSNPPAEFVESYQAQEEIYAIEETLATDPVALWRTEITVVGKTKQYQRKVGLESFISIREQQFPEYLTLKQAKQINPSLTLNIWSQPGTKEYNKVPREIALDELADKWGMTADEVANRVMEIREMRSKLKELRIVMHEQMTKTPIETSKDPTALELKYPDTSLGRPKITLPAAKELSGFFAEHILSEDSLSAYELQRALWKKTRAQRFSAFRSRMQELIVEKGLSIMAAFDQAKIDTLSGKLPVVMDDFFSDMTDGLRESLETVVYFNEELQKYPSEMASTLTALYNALEGKPIPRKKGTGSILFPDGGSAWDRLVFVFSDQPRLLAAVDKMAQNETSAEEAIEMVFERGAYRVAKEGYDIEFHLSNDTEIRTFEKELEFEGQIGFEAMMAHKFVEHEWEAKTKEQIRDETEALKVVLKEPSKAKEQVSFTYEPTGELGLQEQAEQAEMFGEELPEREPSPVPTKAEIEAGTTELKIKLAKEPSFPGTRYEAPIEDAFKELPMLNDNEKQIIVTLLKETGMTAIDMGNLLRANKASVDFSFWRQTRTLAFGHPVNFYRANIEAFKALLSRNAAEANWQWITRDPDYELYETIRQKTKADPLRPRHPRKGGRQYEGTEEFGYLTGDRTLPKIARKLPWIRYSQRAFETGCNTMNWLCWKSYLQNARMRQQQIASGKIKLKEGKAFDLVQEMSGFQKMLADLTQRGSLGPLTEAAPAIGAFAFAPRAAIGRFMTPRHLFASNPRVRLEAWRNLGSYVGVVGGIVALGAFMGLWDIEDDPRSSDFMTIRIGNTRIDPWAGYKQFANLYSRVISGSGVSSVTGAEYETNFTNLMTNFFRGKASPLFSLVLDILDGTTYGGDKLDLGDAGQWFERVLPFSIWDAYEAFQENSRNGWISILPAWVGEGVLTYTGDWGDSWNRMGTPKYEDNLRYGLLEPNYDLADVWADHVSEFKGVDPSELTAEKGYPDWLRFMIETDRLKQTVDQIPTGNLYQLNADPVKNDGKTFVQYYKMWNDYQKAEDKEQWLKDNPLYSDYYLGNMTPKEYASLVKYHSIKDEIEKQEYLENHPELTVSRKGDYLRSHPQENAQLAFWGKSKILTKEAYSHYQQLISKYDVPETALVEGVAPPKQISNDYFDYQDLIGQGFTAGSSEALLFRLEHPEFNDWQFDRTPDNNIEVLRINVMYREEDDIYDSLESETDKKAYLIKNTKYAEARQYRSAYQKGIPEQWIDKYIEYLNIGYTTGAKRATWLMNNYDFFLAVKDVLGWEQIEPSRGYSVGGGLRYVPGY